MNNNQNTQLNQVLGHLKQGRSITQVDAIRLFNCYRLSAIIKNLRNQGYEVVTYNERNSSGIGTHARYELRGGVIIQPSIFDFNNNGIRIVLDVNDEPFLSC